MNYVPVVSKTSFWYQKKRKEILVTYLEDFNPIKVFLKIPVITFITVDPLVKIVFQKEVHVFVFLTTIHELWGTIIGRGTPTPFLNEYLQLVIDKYEGKKQSQQQPNNKEGR